MLPPVAQTLSDSSALVALVGNRIYRHDRAPQKPDRPYVTWYLLSGEPTNTLSEVPGIDRLTIHIDCWHTEDRGIVALATAVRDAIEPYAHCTVIPINEREAETKLYRISLQFDWWLNR